MQKILASIAVMMLPAGTLGETFGWRGDGTGRFPEANPPTEWSKVSRVMSGLRCSADKPKGDAPSGVPACTGALTEWLLLGPLSAADAKTALDEAFVADEASWQPAAGEVVKGRIWRRVRAPGATVDFSPRFAKDNPTVEWVPYHEYHIYKEPLVAYAFTRFHAARAGTVLLRVRAQAPVKVWADGKPVYPTKKPIVLTLTKGWHRILVKAANRVYEKKPAVWSAVPYPSPWYVDLALSATWPFETETKNIRWATAMPSHGAASPVLVGDRIFVLAEPGRLVCVDRTTGKVRWDRAPSFWDTLSAKERGDPAFREVAPLAKRLGEIRAATLTEQLAKERDRLLGSIAKGLKRVDAKRFTVKRGGHGNCLGTPVSDGRAIYVFLGNGLAARYDLDGTLKWATLVSPGRSQEHGITSSPALAGGKLIVFHIDLAGLDAETGRIDWTHNVWRAPPHYGDLTHQTPVTFAVAGQEYVYIHGEIVRADDGRLVWNGKQDWKEKQAIPTPIIQRGVLYDVSSSGKVRRAALPAAGGPIALAKPTVGRTFSRIVGAASRGFTCASPLYHEGLLYTVDCMGTLFVQDAQTLKTVYRQGLGIGFETPSVVHLMGIAYASPVLAGKHVYVFGMDGTTVVLKPGRKCEELARNKIEDMTSPGHWRQKPEGFASTPVAKGECLYIRGDKYLYCIGR